MANTAFAPRPLRFALDGETVFLELDRDDGLDLLQWLGLGRAEFGAIEAKALKPLCVRRLWASPRNMHSFLLRDDGYPKLRDLAPLRRGVWRILSALRDVPAGGLVHFG